MNPLKSSINKASPPFVDLLQLLFIYLKLTGGVDWQWLTVLSPFAITILGTLIVALWRSIYYD